MKTLLYFMYTLIVQICKLPAWSRQLLINYCIVDTMRRFFCLHLSSPIKYYGWLAEMMVWIYNKWKLRLDDTYTLTNLEPSRPSRGEHKTTTKRWIFEWWRKSLWTQNSYEETKIKLLIFVIDFLETFHCMNSKGKYIYIIILY